MGSRQTVNAAFDTDNGIRYNERHGKPAGRPYLERCDMIQSFTDAGTEDVYDGKDTRAARRTCPVVILRVARRKLDQLNRAATLADLKAPPGNRLQALEGDRFGQHSIRINDQYRICFRWTDGGPEAVGITDYH